MIYGFASPADATDDGFRGPGDVRMAGLPSLNEVRGECIFHGFRWPTLAAAVAVAASLEAIPECGIRRRSATPDNSVKCRPRPVERVPADHFGGSASIAFCCHFPGTARLPKGAVSSVGRAAGF